MENKITSLHSTFSVNGEVTENDTRFLNITIDVLHTGKNLNNSFFSKEVVDSCVESIKNTPVLGFIKYNNETQENDFCGHEYILAKTENGVEEKYIGSAFGVIPESCNFRWVSKIGDDGQEREYLQVDALLWEKFSDATSILYRDFEKAHSMELQVSSIEGYEDEETGVFHFTKFKFDGCCLLGQDVCPAMVGSNATIKEVQFTMNDFVKNLQSELNDKFTIFTKLMDKQNEQGGIKTMPNTDFTTVLQMFDDISNTVAQYETIEDRWGDTYPRYYVVDIQENEVIVVDAKNNYNYVSFPFVVNGDSVEIDFESGKRKKISYEDYEEGAVAPEGAFDFGKHIANIEETAFTKVNDANVKVEDAERAKSEAETNYTAIKADYDEIKPKYDAYVQADEQRQAEELNAQKDAKFAEYEDVLSENADFVALKERKVELSVDEIEKECAVLYVKANRAKNSFSKTQSTSTAIGVPVDDGDNDDDYIDTKYGRIRKSR